MTRKQELALLDDRLAAAFATARPRKPWPL